MFKAVVRGLARLGLILGAVIAATWAYGPVESVERGAPFDTVIDDPVAYLAAREAAFDDITPGAEARAIWTGAPGEVRRYALVYLHGFSATSEEIAPVPQDVAAAIDANLVFVRLTGHGRGGQAMAEATAGDWIRDTAEAISVAREMGREVILIGTSTGATLAAYAMGEADTAQDVAGIVMISPNFALSSPAWRVLTWPGARVWGPVLAGRERAFEPQSDAHARYWTTRYPSVATLPMAALVAEVEARDVSGANIPLLMVFSDRDRVISPDAARAFAARWGGPVTLAPQDLPEHGVDPYAHVIAGDILSPAMTEPVTAQIIDWVQSELN